jgi:hypothetical protein
MELSVLEVLNPNCKSAELSRWNQARGACFKPYKAFLNRQTLVGNLVST